MPAQKPGRSKQNYETPWRVLDAVYTRFAIKGMDWDLAADAANAKADCFYDEAMDSLKQDWTQLRGHLWLNPPYANIEPWARKCAESTRIYPPVDRCIYFLVPLSSSEWAAKYVHNRALILAMRGRVSFDETGPYPKDTMLCRFGGEPGFDMWDWRAQK